MRNFCHEGLRYERNIFNYFISFNGRNLPKTGCRSHSQKIFHKGERNKLIIRLHLCLANEAPCLTCYTHTGHG